MACLLSAVEGRFLMAESLCRIIMQQSDPPAQTKRGHSASSILLPSVGLASSRPFQVKPRLELALKAQGREVQGSNKQTQAAGTRALGRKSANGLDPMRCLIDDTAASDFGSGPKQRATGGQGPKQKPSQAFQASKTLGTGRCTGQGNPLTPLSLVVRLTAASTRRQHDATPTLFNLSSCH